MKRNHTDHQKKSVCCTRKKILLRIISAAAVITILLTFMTGCSAAGSKDNTSSIQLNAVNAGSMQITKAEAKAIDTYLYCTADDFVSLRKNASASSAELAKIQRGNRMTYLQKKSGKWYYVKYGSKKGYVYQDYVSFTKPSSGSSSSSATYLYCTANDYVSLRKSASSSSTELAKIPRGTKMRYMNYKSGKWYYVIYNSKKGYVYEDYVSFTSPSSSSSKTSSSSSDDIPAILYCTASDFVSLRKGPSANSTELAKIPRGEKMGYLNKTSGKWYYVQYGKKKGYVYSDYVSGKKP